MKPKRIIRLFARANHDVLRTLVGYRDDTGAFVHTGLRSQSVPGECGYLVQAEPHQRIDHLLSLLEQDPEPLPEWLKKADLGDHPLRAQNRTLLPQARYDALIFSLQSEVEHTLWRHRSTGRTIYLGSSRWRQQRWTSAQREQLGIEFEQLPQLTAEAWLQHFDQVLDRLHPAESRPVILFTGEAPRLRPLVYDYSLGATGPVPLWVRNTDFQIAARDIAVRKGVLIMDAGSLLCGLGVDMHVQVAFRYTAETYRVLTEELRRILADALTSSMLARPPGTVDADI